MPSYPIKHSAQSWRLFEELFLKLSKEKYPFALPPMDRGKAINTAMLLNRCQVQWARENGVPDESLQRSAKAKELADSALWFVEISDSPKRLRRLVSNHMTELLGFVQGEIGAGGRGIRSSAPDSPPAYTPPQRYTPDELIAQTLGINLEPTPHTVGIETTLLTPEEKEHRDAATRHKEELQKVKDKLLAMPFNGSWICQKCDMPVKGLHDSVILRVGEGTEGETYIRICPTCVSGFQKRRT